jgi:hypothetical protein
MRNGHVSSVSITITIVPSRTNADDTSAKPAPGPIYARAGAALASTRNTVNANRVSTL